ncbi:MAG: hypothetical protein ACMXYC_04330 [Candidatus Woesearchaeota archaeon]
MRALSEFDGQCVFSLEEEIQRSHMGRLLVQQLRSEQNGLYMWIANTCAPSHNRHETKAYLATVFYAGLLAYELMRCKCDGVCPFVTIDTIRQYSELVDNQPLSVHASLALLYKEDPLYAQTLYHATANNQELAMMLEVTILLTMQDIINQQDTLYTSS